MKKIIVLVVAVGCIFAVYRYVPGMFSGKKSPVIRSQAETKVDKEGNVKTLVPEAKLPKPEAPKKDLDVLKGTVGRVTVNPGDGVERNIIVVYEGKEPVVVANVQYVHTLEYFYMDKAVSLKGAWRKDAVIYGKPYRAFWIEDIKFLEK